MTPFFLSSGILFLTLTNVCLIVLHGLNAALMFMISFTGILEGGIWHNSVLVLGPGAQLD